VATRAPASTTLEVFNFQAINLASLEIVDKQKFESTSLVGVSKLFYLQKSKRVLGHIGQAVGYFLYDYVNKKVEKILYSYQNVQTILTIPSSTQMVASYKNPFAVRVFDLLNGTSPIEIPMPNISPTTYVLKMIYIKSRACIAIIFSNNNVALYKINPYQKIYERNFATLGTGLFKDIEHDSESGYLYVSGQDTLIGWNPDSDDVRIVPMSSSNRNLIVIVPDSIFIFRGDGSFTRKNSRTLVDIENSQGSLGKIVNDALYWPSQKKILYSGNYNTVEWISVEDQTIQGVLLTDPEISIISYLDFYFYDENLIFYLSNWFKIFDVSLKKQVFSLEMGLYPTDHFQYLSNHYITVKSVIENGFLLMNPFCVEGDSVFTCKKCQTDGLTVFPCQTCPAKTFLKPGTS
jgi:hypothetical protein